MPELRRMLPSSNALFVFDAAARNGSFTAAAAELNVTQPAVSRMLGEFEEYLGVGLSDRTAGRAVLTEEGELLYRRVLDGFRSIESGLVEIERRRKGTETITLSVSSAFTTHWLMPRIDKLQRQFPKVDLRFQLISGSLRGPVENVDLGMRFRDLYDPAPHGALIMKEVMLPVCSPAYRDADGADGDVEPNTIIRLVDTPADWAGQYKGFLTVVSHWLLTGALVPAAKTLTTTRRICEFVHPQDRSVRPVVLEIRDWIIEQMRSDMAAIDRLYPGVKLMANSY